MDEKVRDEKGGKWFWCIKCKRVSLCFKWRFQGMTYHPDVGCCHGDCKVDRLGLFPWDGLRELALKKGTASLPKVPEVGTRYDVGTVVFRVKRIGEDKLNIVLDLE